MHPRPIVWSVVTLPNLYGRMIGIDSLIKEIYLFSPACEHSLPMQYNAKAALYNRPDARHVVMTDNLKRGMIGSLCLD